MKSKKILAYLLGLAMASTSAVAVFAEGEETTAAPTETTAAPVETTAAPVETTAAPNKPEVTPVEGVIYNVYASEGYATVSNVSAEKESIFILDNVGGYPVAFVEYDAFSDASKLKTISVSKKNAYLRDVDGCLYAYTTTKDKNDKDVYHDTLIAVPAGKTAFQLSNACENIWEDTDSVFPNNKVTGNVADGHATFLVVSGKLYDYHTDTEVVKDSSGNWVNADKVVVDGLYDDSIAWKKNGKVGSDTPAPTPGAAGTEDAPQTGSAGVGVALATLLAAGSTAIVLRKRSKR